MNDALRKTLNELGYTNFLPVQKKAIPAIESGKDLFIQAETGSGKTLAYLIPVLEKTDPYSDHTEALIIAPTRELAVQISDIAKKISVRTGHHIITLIGGLDIHKQENALKHRPVILIGTPGRIRDLLDQNQIDLSHLKITVLDEADQIISTGQREETEAILKGLSHYQTVCLSATHSDLLNHFFPHDHEEIILSTDHLNERITAYYIETENKPRTLKQLLSCLPIEQAILFTNYKQDANRIAENLRKKKILCSAFSSDFEEKQRLSILKDFKEGKIRLLIATDAAARGLDLSNVSHIIHYDVPVDDQTFIHRSGRTAHQGNTGTIISLLNKEDEETETGQMILKTGTSFQIPAEKGSDLSRPLKKAKEKETDTVLVQINAGRKDKIRPKDIIGSLCTLFDFKEIGVLEIQDTFSTVTILKKDIHLPDHIRIKGKNRKIFVRR